MEKNRKQTQTSAASCEHEYPFGKEVQVSSERLFTSFCNNLWLGQWELARSCIGQLRKQKDLCNQDVDRLLYSIAENPTGYRSVIIFQACNRAQRALRLRTHTPHVICVRVESCRLCVPGLGVVFIITVVVFLFVCGSACRHNAWEGEGVKQWNLQMVSGTSS